jgi:hypothetical protein
MAIDSYQHRSDLIDMRRHFCMNLPGAGLLSPRKSPRRDVSNFVGCAGAAIVAIAPLAAMSVETLDRNQ